MRSPAFFNGTATTTYAYDAIGNLATTTGAATSTFNWDYRSRMIRAWVSGATSTYAYDHTTARMRQVVGSTTTDYPNKFFSIATTTLTAATSHGHKHRVHLARRHARWRRSSRCSSTAWRPAPQRRTTSIPIISGRRTRSPTARASVKQALDYYPYGCSSDQHGHRCERSHGSSGSSLMTRPRSIT